MHIMCVILCSFSALSRRVGALQISIIIIIKPKLGVQLKSTNELTIFINKIINIIRILLEYCHYTVRCEGWMKTADESLNIPNLCEL